MAKHKPLRTHHAIGWKGGGERTFPTIDYPLFITVLFLFIVGLIFMYSSSAFWGEFYKKDSFYFFKRQVVFSTFGFSTMLFFVKYYHRMIRYFNPFFLLTLTWGILVLALVSSPVANVHRWIQLGPIQIQPSELAKIALLFYVATYLDRNKSRIVKSGMSLIAPFLMTFITLGLIAIEPDIGTPVLLFTVVTLMMYAGGVKVRHIASAYMLVAPMVVYELTHYEYRLKRLLAFLSPETQKEAGYQLLQSLKAISAGGWFGVGIGASTMKMMYLPAPHTDFIFSIMCEELGLFRIMIIVGAFCMILLRGVKIAKNADSLENSVFALGLTLTIVLQAFLNMGMSLGLLPTKGLPLPFFSYGGSSIISTSIMVGILLNISTHKAKLPYGR
jgi:cell division protein FtsW